MNIYVLVEPQYQNSIWCKQTIDGIRSCVKQKRYELFMPCDYEDAIKQVEHNKKKIVILVGTSPKWMVYVYRKLNENDIHTVLISYKPEITLGNTSSILIDNMSAANGCMNYLSACGKNKIALYGINSDSYADLIKRDCFTKRYGDNIYYNEGDIKECYRSFSGNIKNYNSVICANDIVAISLIKNLIEDGYKVPEDLYIISFGNTLIGKYFNPSLTTVELNHEELGKQAVLICSYINKCGAEVNVSIKIPYEISVNKSTDYSKPEIKRNNYNSFAKNDVMFYEDETVSKIIKIESLLNECEEIDFKILFYLLEGEKYDNIALKLFSSENTIKYRVKRMSKMIDADSRTQFVDIISEYIDKKGLNLKKNIDK